MNIRFGLREVQCLACGVEVKHFNRLVEDFVRAKPNPFSSIKELSLVEN